MPRGDGPACDVAHDTHDELRFTIATLPVFVLLLMAQGLFIALGKAAVYEHIPVNYPGRFGVVGGAVGAIGGFGGFALPLAFAVMNDVAGVWTSCFMLFFGIGSISLLWMHFAILRQERRAVPELAQFQFLPELEAEPGRSPSPGLGSEVDKTPPRRGVRSRHARFPDVGSARSRLCRAFGDVPVSPLYVLYVT